MLCSEMNMIMGKDPFPKIAHSTPLSFCYGEVTNSNMATLNNNNIINGYNNNNNNDDNNYHSNDFNDGKVN